MSEYKKTTKNGKVRPAHDVIVEKLSGQPLEKTEVVHHLNGNKQDNREENLRRMDRAEHTRLHHAGAVRSPETLDRMRKANHGRINVGRKLTEQQVKEIAGKLARDDVTITELAEEYGVAGRTIMSIRDGKRYRDYLQEYPDSAFPLRIPKKRYGKSKSGSRKLSEEDVNAIRFSLWDGKSADAVAKQYGVSSQLIRMIWDGEIYKDVLWPENIVQLRRGRSAVELINVFLSEPMSSLEDEYTALKEDYHIQPDLYSVTILRLVRRALLGDLELAVLLMSIGGYGNELDKIIMENSEIMQSMRYN